MIALRVLARFGLVLAVLIGLLGHVALGGDGDCAPLGQGQVVVGVHGGPLDHTPAAAEYAHAHGHDVNLAVVSTPFLLNGAQQWQERRAALAAGTAPRDIERPPRLFLVG